MSAEILMKILTVLFGYVMPVLECLKAVEQWNDLTEQRNGLTDQLLLWCKYWIMLVILMIFDEIAGALLSSIPGWYYVLKLAFLVCLWHPKTRGTDFVYKTFVGPLMKKYGPEIEERLRYLWTNPGDLIVFYLKNFTNKGYELFVFLRELEARFQGDRAAERPGLVDDDFVIGDFVYDDFVNDDFIAGVVDRRAARQRRPAAAVI